MTGLLFYVNMFWMRLLGNYVLIKVDKVPEKQGELYISEGWKANPPTGVVLEVGADVKTVKKDDKVLFLRYAAIDAIEQDERICKEGDIVGVIDG